MAEFTKDIQTLTQQAGSAPQLQTNTGSLATDVISAASFGLGLYRQNKAATALAGAQKQQVEYQTKLDEDTLALRDFSALAESTNLTGTAFRRREAKLLKGMGGGASHAARVIAAKNKLTGQTSVDVDDALRKAEIQRQEDDTNLTNSAIDAAVSSGVSTFGVADMTQEERQALVVQGNIATKKLEVAAAELSYSLQSGAYNKMTDAGKTAAYLSPVVAEWTSGLASRINTGVESSGGFGSLDKEGLFEFITSERTSIEAQVKQHVAAAEAVGVILSPEQQNAFRTSGNAVLDSFEKLMGQEAVTKALGSIPDRMLSQNLVKGLTDAKPEIREASLAVALKLGGNELAGVDIAAAYKILAGISTGDKLPDNDDENKQAAKLVKVALTAPANDDGTFTPEQHTLNKNLVENLLEGTPTQAKKAVKGGSYKALIDAVTEFKGRNFALEDHATTASAISTLGSRVIASASAAAYNAPKSRLVGGTVKDRQFVNTDTAKNFTLDDNTLELIPVDGSFVWISDEVKNYNSYIKSTISALEFVGGDVESFKRDVANSLMVVK